MNSDLTGAQQQKYSKAAIVSLIFGFIPLLSVIGIISGIVSIIKITKPESALKGKGIAISGIIIGSFMTCFTFIILMLSAIALPKLFTAVDNAKIGKAKAEIGAMNSAINIYDADKNKYPDTLEELVPEYLVKLNKTPWNGEYTYTNTGDGTYIIKCKGKRDSRQIVIKYSSEEGIITEE